MHINMTILTFKSKSIEGRSFLSWTGRFKSSYQVMLDDTDDVFVASELETQDFSENIWKRLITLANRVRRGTTT